MSAVLPHYKQGPINKQVSALVIGGMIVAPTTAGTNPSADLSVAPCSAANTRYYLGVAGKDANVIAVQTGAANTYGQPAIDISVLDDYTAVYYGGVDIWVWYQGAVAEGDLLIISATTAGTVITNGAGTDPTKIVGKCTHPGGVSAGMLVANTLIGGSTYFLGRARIF
jgi:hypothetical protein